MRCPHCESADTSERQGRTELGYRRFRCRACHREFNERTGTRFNHLQYPTDVVCLVVLWRVMSWAICPPVLRGVTEIFARWLQGAKVSPVAEGGQRPEMVRRPRGQELLRWNP